MKNHGGGEAVYGLGLIGAALYYIQHAANFGEVIVGIVKSIVWPAMFIYRLYGLLKM
jgi:hypothetical protein